jgi:carbonic anhydrase
MKYAWAIVCLSFIVACAQSDDAAEGHEEQAARHADVVHWRYEGNEGPDHWADLSEAYSLCRSGTEQSPIDLTDPVLVETSSWLERIGDKLLTEGQRATAMDLVDNGHTIQVTNDIPLVAIVDGTEFELVQYHFHAPSEHTVNGRHSPLEVHFVHKSAGGELAVVGVLVEEGAHDPLWDVVISALPMRPGDERHLRDLDLDPRDIRPQAESYYRYQGSLTTPPCTENVKWIVPAETKALSPDQMSAIVSRLHDNNRPVQPLGERTLSLNSPVD